PFLCRFNRTRHLNDLKKENFSLKLRIYFLEEKIQQKFDQSGDGTERGAKSGGAAGCCYRRSRWRSQD
uniref:Centrosomin N-terminal motif 1 domain-containing protein n=2 Tax=Poecilia TaxID=8080 RepID=A0A3B3U5Y2_9TELE